MTPVTIHVPIKSEGEPTSRAISADTIKMPDPIMLPITNAIALARPIPLTNSSERGVTSDTVDELLVTKSLYFGDLCILLSGTVKLRAQNAVSEVI